MDLTEDQLLDAIRRVFSGAGPEVVVGPGDDAAVVSPGSGEQVLTTDAMVEGVHFRTDLTTPRDLGYKAIAVNVSDMAAMAASPRFALCALTLSTAIDAAWVVELAGGMRECCDEFALSLVGGNLSRGDEVSIVVTVTGEVVPGRAVRRDGARPGDRVVVTGSAGRRPGSGSPRSVPGRTTNATRSGDTCGPPRGSVRRASSRATGSPR
jgi:thiamine-monophosphate kinase